MGADIQMDIVTVRAGLRAAAAIGILSVSVVNVALPERLFAQALLSEPRIVAQTVEAVGKSKGSGDGFYPELGGMITGAGWISAGPGVRRHFLNDRGLADVSAALSWRAYKIVQGRVEVTGFARGHLSLGSQALWQDATQVSYFGIGNTASLGARTQYRLRSTDVVGYAHIQMSRRSAIDLRGGRLFRPVVSGAVGPFNGGFPDTRAAFGEAGAPGSTEPPSFLHGDVSVTIDTRDRPGYARSGGMLRARWSAQSDRASGAFSFQQYEGEGIRYIPTPDRRWILALHGWVVASETRATQSIPFFFLPSLGGQDTLRGYLDYRFHDRNLAVVNVESRLALFAHVDAALFVDAGSVASRVNDLNLGQTSFGFGLRAHTRTSVIGRCDVAHGPGGWRVVFRMSDALAPARLSRHTAAVPFVP